MPSCLEITALSEDGIVMGIRHATLPMAAVQFHPESILTSPAHGMAILENALSVLRYNDHVVGGDDDTNVIYSPGRSGAQLVGDLEKLTVPDLTLRLDKAGLSTTGSKSELLVRLALWMHKRNEARAGRLNLTSLTVAELRELKGSLGLLTASDMTTQDELTQALQACLSG
jgi:anthranilate synthase